MLEFSEIVKTFFITCSILKVLFIMENFFSLEEIQMSLFEVLTDECVLNSLERIPNDEVHGYLSKLIIGDLVINDLMSDDDEEEKPDNKELEEKMNEPIFKKALH